MLLVILNMTDLPCVTQILNKLQIKPLITPTRRIMTIGVDYDWHELFPKGNFLYFLNWCFKVGFDIRSANLTSICHFPVGSNAGAITAIWAPVIFVSINQQMGSSLYLCPNS